MGATEATPARPRSSVPGLTLAPSRSSLVNRGWGPELRGVVPSHSPAPAASGGSEFPESSEVQPGEAQPWPGDIQVIISVHRGPWLVGSGTARRGVAVP